LEIYVLDLQSHTQLQLSCCSQNDSTNGIMQINYSKSLWLSQAAKVIAIIFAYS